MYDKKGYTVEAIAKTIGVNKATVYRHLAGAPKAATAQTHHR